MTQCAQAAQLTCKPVINFVRKQTVQYKKHQVAPRVLGVNILVMLQTRRAVSANVCLISAVQTLEQTHGKVSFIMIPHAWVANTWRTTTDTTLECREHFNNIIHASHNVRQTSRLLNFVVL